MIATNPGAVLLCVGSRFSFPHSSVFDIVNMTDLASDVIEPPTKRPCLTNKEHSDVVPNESMLAKVEMDQDVGTSTRAPAMNQHATDNGNTTEPVDAVDAVEASVVDPSGKGKGKANANDFVPIHG